VSTRLGNILAHNTQFFSDEFVSYTRQPSGDSRVRSRGHPRFAWMRTCLTSVRHRQRTKCLRGSEEGKRASRGKGRDRAIHSHVTHERLDRNILYKGTAHCTVTPRHVYIVNRSHVKISHSHVASRNRTDDPAFVKRNRTS